MASGILSNPSGGATSPTVVDEYSIRTPGRYYHSLPPNLSTTSRAFGPGVATLTPFIVSKTQSFDRIGVHVATVGGAGALARLGILADPGSGYPDPATVLLDAGTVPTDGTTGFKENVCAVTLTPGIYWLVCAPQVASTTFLAGFSSGNTMLPPMAMPTGTGLPGGSSWHKSGAAAGPLSATSWSDYDANPLNGVPLLLRAA